MQVIMRTIIELIMRPLRERKCCGAASLGRAALSRIVNPLHNTRATLLMNLLFTFVFVHMHFPRIHSFIKLTYSYENYVNFCTSLLKNVDKSFIGRYRVTNYGYKINVVVT